MINKSPDSLETTTGQKTFILINNPRFQKDISKFRKKHKISKGGFNSNDEGRIWHRNLLKQSGKRGGLNEYQRDLDSILIEFSLSVIYRSFIERYIKFNQLEWPRRPLKIFFKYNKKLERREIFIQVFSSTTLKDVKASWGDIGFLKKYLAKHKDGRSRVIGNLLVEQRAYELSTKKSKKPKEIVKILKKEGFGSYGYEYVSKLINRFGKRIESSDS